MENPFFNQFGCSIFCCTPFNRWRFGIGAVVSSNDFQNMATASLAGVGPSTEHWSVFFVHWASSYCPLRYMFVQVNSMHRVVKILPSFFTTEDVINLVSSLENSIFLWVLWRTTFSPQLICLIRKKLYFRSWFLNIRTAYNYKSSELLRSCVPPA